MLESLEFRGEGNQNFVVVDRCEMAIYRLPKACKEKRDDNAVDIRKQTSEELLKRTTSFSDHVMKPLLGEHFVTCGELVQVSPEFVEHVNKCFQEKREAFRLVKNVDLTGVALKMPDLCYLPAHINDILGDETSPTYSFEIKPKSACGVMYKDELGNSICQYCLHQRLYVKQGKYKTRSRYCPADLFSGNKARMKEAIHGLLDTPQNNLVIFKNGKRLYDRHQSSDVLHTQVLADLISESSTMDRLAQLTDVLIQALLHVPNATNNSQNSTGSDSIPVGCVLEKLHRLQIMSSHSAKEISNFYANFKKHITNNPTDSAHIGFLDGVFDASFLPSLDEFQSRSEADIEYIAAQLMKFKIAKSARDCSIMITLRPVSKCYSNIDVLSTEDGEKFAFKVSLFDLDPKSFNKLPGYVELEETLLEVGRDSVS